jgi:nucleoside-diphosphate-sugar epimerase
MKILVTGGAGFFGSKLVEHLIQKDYSVTVYDILHFGNNGCKHLEGNPLYEFVKGDVRDYEKLKPILLDSDVVIHMAAYVGEPVCKQNLDSVYHVNTDSTKFISETCEKNEIQFIFLSTCSNYGKSEEIVNESSVLNPLGLYSDSKIKAENYILENSQNQLVLRCSTLFGVSNRMRYDLTINQFLYEIKTKNLISVFGEEAWRPYIHIEDACEIIIKAMEEKLTGVYNVGDESLNFTKKQIIDILKNFGLSFEVEHVKWDDPRDYKVDFSKLHSMIDYKIKFSIQDGIQQIVNHINNEISN